MPHSVAQGMQERGNGKILSNGQAPKRVEGCQKEPRRPVKSQDLTSWEDSGPAVLDLGLLLLASYSESTERTGLLAGRLPSEDGARRRTTKRLGAIRGHLAWV